MLAQIPRIRKNELNCGNFENMVKLLPEYKNTLLMMAENSLRSSKRGSLTICIAMACTMLWISPLPAQAQTQGLAGKDDRPYDGKLLRLSEILGAVHYLRELCGAQEGQLWRKQMGQLLNAEGTSAIRRVKLTKSFNKGYRGYRRTYRNCTKSAKLAISRFMTEGVVIAEALVNQNK